MDIKKSGYPPDYKKTEKARRARRQRDRQRDLKRIPHGRHPKDIKVPSERSYKDL